MRVIKKITSGASYYGATMAIATIKDARRSGVLPCGSGDDYKLKRKEKKIIEGASGESDIVLDSGPLN